MSEKDKVLDEQTAAAASLKPSNTTKSELLSQMMKHFAGMKKEDLSSYLEKTLAQVGKEADTVPDTSAKNKASVATTHPGTTGPLNVSAYNVRSAMKEDMDEMFADSEDLSEEFKTKASAIFEAAVENRVQLEITRLEEEFETKLEEEVTKSVDELNEQVEKYLDYVAEKWMEDNKVEVEKAIRLETTEKFIEGLKNLFKESYIEIPEEKVDVVEEMTQTISQLETQLESVEAKNVELSALIKEAKQDEIFDEVSEDLVDTQVEKLRSLAEGIIFESLEEYKEKLEIVKEQYFTEGKSSSRDSGLINEDASIGSNDAVTATTVDASMRPYVEAISKTLRK
jgi:hypothetical protein